VLSVCVLLLVLGLLTRVADGLGQSATIALAHAHGIDLAGIGPNAFGGVYLGSDDTTAHGQ